MGPVSAGHLSVTQKPCEFHAAFTNFLAILMRPAAGIHATIATVDASEEHAAEGATEVVAPACGSASTSEQPLASARPTRC